MTQTDASPEGQVHLEPPSTPSRKGWPRWYLWLALIVKLVSLFLLVVILFNWLF